MTSERPARGYLPALDGVRGLGMLAVMLVHFVAHTTATNRVEAAVFAVLAYGGLGVDLFFILSGFLITGILCDTRHHAGFLRSFWMRRALRIVPLYYAVLAVVFLVVPLFSALRGGELEALRSRQEWAWLYGVNVYLALQGGWVLSYIQHFWTLAVETHFYLLWPLVVWALADRPRALMGTALALAALSFGGRVAAWLAGVNPVAITALTPFQLDALCLGGFFAVRLRQPGGEAALRRAVAPLALAAGAVLAGDFAAERLTDNGLPLLQAMRSGIFRLLLGAFFLGAVFAPPSSALSGFLRSRPLTALGKYSYGIYVFHHFLSYYFVLHGTEFALARAVGSHTLAVVLQASVGMAVSIVAGWLSFEYFERYFLDLKRFWPSSGQRRRAVAEAPMPALPMLRRNPRRPLTALETGLDDETSGVTQSITDRKRPVPAGVRRLVGVALVLTACAAGPALAQDRAATPARSGASPAPGYVIGLADVLRVVVWKEPDLTLDVTVRPDGMITLPLLGDVPAAGRVPSELARALVAKIEEFIESPRVTVSVTQSNARVYVVGQMVRPGEFPLSGRMTVLKALALAGGFKEFARSDSIVIIREDQTVINFNFKRIADGKDVSQNVLLAPGDTIVVP